MTRYHRWTDAELDTLRRLYPTHTGQEIADLLGLPLKKVYSKAHTIGLNKPGDWIAERSRRIMAQPHHPARKSWFKPGHTPVNKGKPFRAGGRSAETHFRPGQMPHNWRAVGADRVSKEGYLQRKVADSGVSRRDYVPVHHLIWRMHGRDIPPGYALCFVDGDKRNVDINNLELVPRAELMRRNSVHQLPKEAALAAQLVGCIRRQINRRTRQQQQEITE